MKKVISITICLLLLSLSGCEITDFPENENWQIETVGDIEELHFDFAYSLGLDSNDKAHISCIGDTGLGRELKYATNASGEWEVETLDNFEHTSEMVTSIALDSNNKVHISYLGTHSFAYWDDLKYVTNASGEWVIETVESVLDGHIDSAALALDSNDNAHISYDGRWDIKYATNASGSWVIEVLSNWPVCNRPSSTSLAIDFQDKVHIIFQYSDLTLSEARTLTKYATDSSGSWTIEEVLQGFRYLTEESFALDSENKVHFSDCPGCGMFTPPRLCYNWVRYVTNASGAWVIRKVDRDLTLRYSSLAIDSNDKVYIGYAISGKGIHVATNASGKWVTEPVVDGYYISLAIDSNDKLHFIYLSYDSDSSTTKLNYAQHK